MTCAEPALDPQPARVVEVPDVAGAVPARVAGAVLLGGPQPVVPVLDVRGADAHLAGDTGVVGERPVRPAVRRASGLTAHARPPRADGPTHTPSPGARGLDLVERDVGHRQRLGHAVRRVQLGGGQQRAQLVQQRRGNRRAGREDEPDPAERVAVPVGQSPASTWRRRCAARRARRTPPWRRPRPRRRPARRRSARPAR